MAIEVLAVSSGKGGVGKTILSILKAMRLHHQFQKRVLLVDGDLGLANVDQILGLNPLYDLGDYFNGDTSIQKMILKTSYGFDVLPSGSGISELQNLTMGQQMVLRTELNRVFAEYDLVVIDLGAGINQQVSNLAGLATHQVVVVTPEPHAMQDGMGMIATLQKEILAPRISVLVNQAFSKEEGESVFKDIEHRVTRLGGSPILCGGVIRRDPALQQAVFRSRHFFAMAEKMLCFSDMERVVDTLVQKPEAAHSQAVGWV